MIRRNVLHFKKNWGKAWLRVENVAQLEFSQFEIMGIVTNICNQYEGLFDYKIYEKYSEYTISTITGRA